MGDQEEMCLRAEQNALLGERGWGGDGDMEISDTRI